MPTPASLEPTLYVIDDDQAVLESLVGLLAAAGYQTRAFASAESFLAEPILPRPGCVITDLKLGGMSGQDLQKWLTSSGFQMPLIVVTGHATVDVAVEIMETGAVTLLQKPYKPHALMSAVARAVEQATQSFTASTSATSSNDELMEFRRRLANLDDEEQQVMRLMIAGSTNKAISAEIGCSMRTIDRRRSSILEKLAVQTLPELARIYGALERELVSRPL